MDKNIRRSAVIPDADADADAGVQDEAQSGVSDVKDTVSEVGGGTARPEVAGLTGTAQRKAAKIRAVQAIQGARAARAARATATAETAAKAQARALQERAVTVLTDASSDPGSLQHNVDHLFGPLSDFAPEPEEAQGASAGAEGRVVGVSGTAVGVPTTAAAATEAADTAVPGTVTPLVQETAATAVPPVASAAVDGVLPVAGDAVADVRAVVARSVTPDHVQDGTEHQGGTYSI